MTYIALVVSNGLLIALSATIFLAIGWWAWYEVRKERTRANAASEQFARRLASPDLAGLERHLGHALPASFRAMYQDRELILSDDVLIDVPNPLEGDEECYVAWFQPADVESVGEVPPDCDGLFPIADNGAGDKFLVDLRQTDPEVIYYLHETGERKGIGVTLSAFLRAPRRPVPDE
jgi:hypothetical protein